MTFIIATIDQIVIHSYTSQVWSERLGLDLTHLPTNWQESEPVSVKHYGLKCSYITNWLLLINDFYDYCSLVNSNWAVRLAWSRAARRVVNIFFIFLDRVTWTTGPGRPQTPHPISARSHCLRRFNKRIRKLGPSFIWPDERERSSLCWAIASNFGDGDSTRHLGRPPPRYCFWFESILLVLLARSLFNANWIAILSRRCPFFTSFRSFIYNFQKKTNRKIELTSWQLELFAFIEHDMKSFLPIFDSEQNNCTK